VLVSFDRFLGLKSMGVGGVATLVGVVQFRGCGYPIPLVGLEFSLGFLVASRQFEVPNTFLIRGLLVVGWWHPRIQLPFCGSGALHLCSFLLLRLGWAVFLVSGPILVANQPPYY